MSGLMKAIYHGVTKKTSTFAFAIAVGAFGFERGKFINFCVKSSFRFSANFQWIFAAIDTGVDKIWDAHNSGKLWTHIKHKYENKEE